MADLLAMQTEESRNLGIRFDPEFSAWLKQFEENTGIGAVALGRALFNSARAFYDKHHYLVFPLEIMVSKATDPKTIATAVITEESIAYADQKQAERKAAKQRR